jgi:hypothetical protein
MNACQALLMAIGHPVAYWAPNKHLALASCHSPLPLQCQPPHCSAGGYSNCKVRSRLHPGPSAAANMHNIMSHHHTSHLAAPKEHHPSPSLPPPQKTPPT